MMIDPLVITPGEIKGGEKMEALTLRIKRYREAFPEESKGKTDIEVGYYLEFHRDLKKEVNRVLQGLVHALGNDAGGNRRGKR